LSGLAFFLSSLLTGVLKGLAGEDLGDLTVADLEEPLDLADTLGGDTSIDLAIGRPPGLSEGDLVLSPGFFRPPEEGLLGGLGAILLRKLFQSLVGLFSNIMVFLGT
jgi:hypothetical protein